MNNEDQNKNQSSNQQETANSPGSSIPNSRLNYANLTIASAAVTNSVPPSLVKIGLKPTHLAQLSEAELLAIEAVARNHLQNQESIEIARRGAKTAATHAKSVRAEFLREEVAIQTESAVILEAARSAAEVASAPIDTPTAIRAALKLARTSKQKFGLLLRLRDYELKFKAK